jgi:hypothetical protein
LDDTQAISALFRGRVKVWQRLNAAGRVEDLPYEELSLYERWLHGGTGGSNAWSNAWMSVETGAIFLSHLIRGGGLPFVGVMNGQVRAYAETYPGIEPEPYGPHLHLAHLILSPLAQSSDTLDAVLNALIEETRRLGCPRLTVSLSSYDTDGTALYGRYDFKLLETVRSYSLSAQTGQSFYQAVEHPSSNPAQIEDWNMSVGRTQSARQHWVTLWPHLWDAIEELAAHRVHRLKFTASGQEAFVCCQQHLYQPRSVDVYLWSPKPMTSHLLTALRDWAHRQGYRTLVFAVPEPLVKLLGSEIELNPQQQQIHALDV